MWSIGDVYKMWKTGERIKWKGKISIDIYIKLI